MMMMRRRLMSKEHGDGDCDVDGSEYAKSNFRNTIWMMMMIIKWKLRMYFNFDTIWMDLACIHEIALQQLKSQYWIQLNSSWQRNCQKPSTKGKSTRDMKVKLVLIVANSSAPVNWGNMRRCIIKWDIEMNIKFHKSVVKLMYAKETESEPSWWKWNWSIFLKMQVKSWPSSSTEGV